VLHLEIETEYADERTAELILGSVSPDNGSYVRSELNGNRITFRMAADDAGTLRSTADDLLACIKIAEEASGLVSGTVPDLDGDAFSE
jgi:tRNA threonylcarbamoyladenosine modification (KEOPS) complex  Pcc1 subunit